MKIEALKKRLDKNRPMTTITICIPEDVIEDLKCRGVSDEVIQAALHEATQQ